MRHILNKDTVLIGNGALQSLEINRFIGLNENGETTLESNRETIERIFDEDAMMDFLRNNPEVANELVSYEGHLIYNGRYRHQVGMDFMNRNSKEMEGNNRYGIFLEKCRDRYIQEVKSTIIEEKPVRQGQVTVDFRPHGSEVSDIEYNENNGNDRYIHVDLYRPSKSARYSEASREREMASKRYMDSDVKFHTFECPFGTTYRHKLRVSNAVEVSLYYEQALRGDLDWKILIDNLKNKGLVKGLSASDEARLIEDMTNQFAWMKEKILRDSSLADKVIVAESMIIPDLSMGRTVYHPELAPSPAHVLARYINNPLLLYAGSENGVIRALEKDNKEEPLRFSSVNGKGEVTIVMDGSDTIGGREEGTTSEIVKKRIAKLDSSGNTMYDKYGNVIYEVREVREIAFKPNDKIELDYASFSDRMDTILKNINPEVKIRFISGINIGADRMLERYVSERNGSVHEWSYSTASLKNAKGHDNNGKGDRFSVIKMKNLSTIYPVLVGRRDSISFNLSEFADETSVNFRRSDLPVDGFLSFTMHGDKRNNWIIERGSLAASSGKPYLLVIDNLGEKEQVAELSLESEKVKFSILGEPMFNDSLFNGEVKNQWDLESGTIWSHMPSGNFQMAIPFIANRYDASVFVNNTPFNSVYGIYYALLMKEAGLDDRQAFKELSAASEGMISLQDKFNSFMRDVDFTDATMERCMRNAVHMMSRASSVFVSDLIKTGESDIVCVSTLGDQSLFTDLDGKGENRVGVILMSERTSLQKELELARVREESEEKKIDSEMKRRSKKLSVRAEGRMVAEGLPKTHKEAGESIWFLGTNTPVEIALDPNNPSLVLWEEGFNQDILNREKAGRQYVEDVDGERIPNNYLYFFPSNLRDIAKRFPDSSDPESRDLTGLTRIDPKTNEPYPCAFGIAVKANKGNYEFDNALGKRPSFLLDNKGALVANSIFSAYSEAVRIALDKNLALCFSAYSTRNGGLQDNLSRVFNDKIWGLPRDSRGSVVPIEKSIKEYDPETRTVESKKVSVIKKTYIDNPHAAPKNLALVKRFENILQRGSSYPLTCVSLPKEDYSDVLPQEFLSDLNFALNMANASAIACGKTLNFPLDEAGRINLGPGVPDDLREIAEERIKQYIGKGNDLDVSSKELLDLRRIPVYQAFSMKEKKLERMSTDIMLRPNDLLVAFGRYDFHDVLVGNKGPIHEMAFIDKDNDIFKITNTKFTTVLSKSELNKYLRYELNDECRFSVKSSDSSKIPLFLASLNKYISDAKGLEIEYKLLSETEYNLGNEGLSNLPYDGYVYLLGSNEDNVNLTDKHVLSARPEETMMEMNPDWVNNRSRQGPEDDNVYAGKVEANDGFKGWVLYRYTMPDGTTSGWNPVNDLELAKDIVLTSVHRTYNTDTRALPSPKVIDAMLKSNAVNVIKKAVENDSKHDKNNGEAIVEENVIRFTESIGGYQIRTKENATADDVDFTLAFAVDFTTYGEKATARAAGDSLISIDIPLMKKGGIDMSSASIDRIVSEIVDSLPDEFVNDQTCGFNIAGNGIYTLEKSVIDQNQIDEFLCLIGSELKDRGVKISNIRSGGQTGVDEAGIVMAKVLNISAHVHAPKGWLFRDKNGKDISDKDAFVNRFTSKDYKKLSSLVKQKSKKQARNPKKGQNSPKLN